MPNSIPASQLVNVTPSVLGSGGSPLALNAVFITRDNSIPLGAAYPFTGLAAVQSWFGSGSTEAALAAVYFNGYDNSQIKPATLYFAQSNSAVVSAYCRSAPLTMTLTQLQALSGTLILTVDGTLRTSSTINLSGATSFSNAASLIQTGIGASVTCAYDSLRAAFVISSVTTGASSTITTCTGTLSTSLGLTTAAGAVTSQGAIAATPSVTMNLVTAAIQNWVSFTTVYEPILSDKLLFAAWANTASQRYVYVCADSDATAVQSGNTTSFGPLTATYNGVCPVWGTLDKAAFVCGTIASIDFTQTNGRIAFAYKSQSGLVADVTDATTAANLDANGYNFYANYATASQPFTFLQPGSVQGSWLWLDPFVNQIYFNSQLQLAVVSFLTASRSVPYNNSGYGGIRSALLDPITQAVNAGIIRAGVPLSSAQAAVVNTAAGLAIDATLSQVGWYLQILPASAQTRGQRSSPPINLWYTDGGSIRTINIASIDII